MRISCPICDTGFNVSEKQVGQKGLCPKCSTKFIIPSDPDDDIEILAEGEIPEKSEKKESTKSERLSEKRKKKRDSERERGKNRTSTRLIDDDEGGDDDDEFDTGGAGKIIGMLAIGLIIGLAIGFVLGRMTAGSGDGDDGNSPEKPETEASGDTTDPFDLNNS